MSCFTGDTEILTVNNEKVRISEAYGRNLDEDPIYTFSQNVEGKVEVSKVLNVTEMGIRDDRETVEIIRSMTDVPICVDVNQGWNDREQALRMIDWLAERNCLFVEQPMPKEKFDDMVWLKSRSSLPLIADEAFQRIGDITRLAEAYDGINIKLMKSTGLHEAYKMVILARALGMKVMLMATTSLVLCLCFLH